ncbi:glycosyl transferase family 1 [Oscillatoria sp. CS-180]|uniref:glycosyltransferase n=1 Tax=Oscillatoria sp. CS-180 TaxID=3021720 RepID=UPI00232CDD93|nr:glycosyltransferase [Oscillatoria sp. CS-180]MDB9526584.1 glycosyl transferase family 1 [Oscillatoria sp. CS-180]
MKQILFLAPQPFYQDRGTPIAVNLMLKVYSERGDVLDVITYHEGEDVTHPNIQLIRTPSVPLISNIRPGFSWKKLVCDTCMFFQALHLVTTRKYQFVHAVEESVFIALVLKLLFGIPYLYDMDSSLSQQIVEQYPKLTFVSRVLGFLEGIAVKQAEVVIPVCDRLAEDIRHHNPRKVVVLPDVSLVG